MKRNLLLTFDYELFLGKRSGSVDKCMIKPTESILKIINKFKCKAVFFVDATYLLKLKQTGNNYPAAKRDFEKIKNQIQEIIKNGHYVFLHLHTHWLDAIYDSGVNQWTLEDTSRFSFANLDPEEQEFVFSNSTG